MNACLGNDCRGNYIIVAAMIVKADLFGALEAIRGR
jgi:hypothetical protein